MSSHLQPRDYRSLVDANLAVVNQRSGLLSDLIRFETDKTEINSMISLAPLSVKVNVNKRTNREQSLVIFVIEVRSKSASL